MATVASSTLKGDGFTFTWTPITNANADGAPVSSVLTGDRCVQVSGTFGGATITMQGSLDGSTWATLSDPTGTALTFTAAGLKGISEAAKFIRPLLSGGSGSSVTVRLFVRKG